MVLLRLRSQVWFGYLGALFLTAVVTGVIALVRTATDVSNISMLYLLAVLAAPGTLWQSGCGQSWGWPQPSLRWTRRRLERGPRLVTRRRWRPPAPPDTARPRSWRGAWNQPRLSGGLRDAGFAWWNRAGRGGQGRRAGASCTKVR